MKISIVTPSNTKGQYISETIKSVLSQEGNFYLEYIVIDNRSHDGTIDILREYEELLGTNGFPVACLGVSFRWLSESDFGLYHAINKGFLMTTGDVYAWINADDIYLPGAFALVAHSFLQFPDISWLKGITSYIDASSLPISSGCCYLYDQAWLQDGTYGREAYFVQQDSVFWRAGLWRSCGAIPGDIRVAGDYWLWTQFSRLTPLYSINRTVSCFRRSSGQLSEDVHSYSEECRRIVCGTMGFDLFKRKLFFYIERRFPVCAGSNAMYRLFWAHRTHQYIDAADLEKMVLRTTKGYFVEGVGAMPYVCPICRSENCHVCFDLSDDRHGYPGTFPLVSCDSCGHRFLMAAFNPAQIVELYTRFYPRRNFTLADYRPSVEVRGIAAWFSGASRSAYSRVPRNVRVLDIGCGFGETIGYHQGRGCDAHGVEADENVLRVAERFGLNIKTGMFDPAAYETDYFDYVTLDQVLEHMTDPCAALLGIKRVLKPGGRVIISAPNVEGWGARLFRRRWINWHAPYHLHHFSRRSLRLAAEQAGLVLERTETITASEWLHYQWAHLATYPESGVPSVYWTPKAEQNCAVRIVLKGLLLLRRTGANHLITRLFDLFGIGDNRLYFLRKP